MPRKHINENFVHFAPNPIVAIMYWRKSQSTISYAFSKSSLHTKPGHCCRFLESIHSWAIRIVLKIWRPSKKAPWNSEIILGSLPLFSLNHFSLKHLIKSQTSNLIKYFFWPKPYNNNGNNKKGKRTHFAKKRDTLNKYVLYGNICYWILQLFLTHDEFKPEFLQFDASLKKHFILYALLFHKKFNYFLLIYLLKLTFGSLG